MGPSTLTPDSKRAGNFRNDILKFFILTWRRSNQGQVFKKRLEAVCLNAFILLLALSRNNDVNVVKLKKRSHQKQRLPSERSARSARHLAPRLAQRKQTPQRKQNLLRPRRCF